MPDPGVSTRSQGLTCRLSLPPSPTTSSYLAPHAPSTPPPSHSGTFSKRTRSPERTLWARGGCKRHPFHAWRASLSKQLSRGGFTARIWRMGSQPRCEPPNGVRPETLTGARGESWTWRRWVDRDLGEAGAGPGLAPKGGAWRIKVEASQDRGRSFSAINAGALFGAV